MSLDVVAEVKDELIRIGCAGEKSVFCVNHFSHNGSKIHDELVPLAEEYGFILSYDGMVQAI